MACTLFTIDKMAFKKANGSINREKDKRKRNI